MLTRQEMFNLAYIGLRNQGFRRCDEDDLDGSCLYTKPDPLDSTKTLHCAWGHVDPTIPISFNRASVQVLHQRGIGLAAELAFGDPRQLVVSDLAWAGLLQATHDRATSPNNMRFNLEVFAEQHHLTVPK